MLKIETRTALLSELQLNPDNPRTIKGEAFDKLVKSLKEFPDMLQLREIVVDETMTVLGGNMRLLALRKIGVKNCMTKIVTGLTPGQKRAFVIKDNASFGDWDWDVLANEWDDLPLADWGLDLPEDWLDIDDASDDEEKESQDKQKIRDDCENGILICIGFCDILVHPKMPEFNLLYKVFGSKYDYPADKKEKLLQCLCNEVKIWA